MRIELRPLASIRPYPNNPRMNEAAVDRVAASIREFGFRQPIVVDQDGVIVVGHVRYKAALKLGLETVPVHVATDLTPEQIKAYRIADNKTAELSDWDYDLLPIELSELQAVNYDLGLLGFDQDDLAKLFDPGVSEGLCDPDEVPAPPDEAITRPGDLWLLGRHRLLCGDSGKAEDVDRLLDGAPIHLVNTDPPYGVKLEPRSSNAIAAGLSSFEVTHHQKLDVVRHPEKAKPTNKKLRAKDRPLANDFVGDEEFARLLLAWFGNIARVLLPGRAYYAWGGYSNIANYPRVLQATRLFFSQAIIWHKQHPVLTRKDFMGILRKVWGAAGPGSARAQSVLMSVWRTCWQQGRSALDFLSQLLRGPPPPGCATPGLNVCPAEAAVALPSRDRHLDVAIPVARQQRNDDAKAEQIDEHHQKHDHERGFRAGASGRAEAGGKAGEFG